MGMYFRVNTLTYCNGNTAYKGNYVCMCTGYTGTDPTKPNEIIVDLY